MNGLDQRERHTALTTVTRRQDDLETVLRALAGELVTVREGLAAETAGRVELAERVLAALDEAHHHAIDQAERQRAYVDAADAQLPALTFWRRLRWLVRGL